MRLYLAHPIDSRKTVRAWELRVEQETGIELFNPFYDTHREDIEELDRGFRRKWDVDSDVIVRRDFRGIDESDGIVAVIDGSQSYGTIFEVARTHCAGDSVYLIVTNGAENHPWLRFYSDRIFTSFEQFEQFVKDTLCRGS